MVVLRSAERNGKKNGDARRETVLDGRGNRRLADSVNFDPGVPRGRPVPPVNLCRSVEHPTTRPHQRTVTPGRAAIFPCSVVFHRPDYSPIWARNKGRTETQ